MKLRPLRIWNPWLRLAGVVVLWGLTGALGWVSAFIDDPGVIGFFSVFAAIFAGSWVFRGRGEAVDPSRPWWQLTSRSRMSRAWGVTAIVFAVVYAIGIPILYFPPSPHLRERAHLHPPTVAGGVALAVLVVQCILIAVLYLHSAAKLRRRESDAETTREAATSCPSPSPRRPTAPR